MPLTARGYYKGPTIILNPGDKYPFSFGINKARLIVATFAEIKAFVDEQGPPATGPDYHDMREEDRMREQCGA